MDLGARVALRPPYRDTITMTQIVERRPLSQRHDKGNPPLSAKSVVDIELSEVRGLSKRAPRSGSCGCWTDIGRYEIIATEVIGR